MSDNNIRKGEVIEYGEMTDDTITESVKTINSRSGDPRMQFLMNRLVTHLHTFARETRLTTDEWMAAVEFLTQVGKISSDIRQEFVLLSDIFGLSVLVDAISHPKSKEATTGTLLGPFHTHDSNEFEECGQFASDGKGEPCAIYGTVSDTKGNPLENVSVELWETDDTGHYDTQYADRQGPDCRGIFHTNKDGKYYTKGILPVSYPIPHDGPVGKLLEKLNRHPYRPAHIHFMVNKDGYDELITALYMKGDRYENSDAVFGSKKDLIVEPKRIEDPDFAKQSGLKVGDWYINFDVVLMSKEEGIALFDKQSREALKEMNIDVAIRDGLPIAELD